VLSGIRTTPADRLDVLLPDRWTKAAQASLESTSGATSE
jgi:hypothetical protein